MCSTTVEQFVQPIRERVRLILVEMAVVVVGEGHARVAGEFEKRNVFFHPVSAHVYRLDAFEPH
jgi:hypothetical protein